METLATQSTPRSRLRRRIAKIAVAGAGLGIIGSLAVGGLGGGPERPSLRAVPHATPQSSGVGVVTPAPTPAPTPDGSSASQPDSSPTPAPTADKTNTSPTPPVADEGGSPGVASQPAPLPDPGVASRHDSIGDVSPGEPVASNTPVEVPATGGGGQPEGDAPTSPTM